MKIHLSKKKNWLAATIAEVVISIALVGITAMGVLGSLSYGFFVMELARENQRATQILLEKVETIRLYNWSQVTNTAFIPTSFTNYYDPQASAGSMGTVYRGTMIITNTPWSDSAGYRDRVRQLTVTLNWNSKNIPHTRTLSTYVAQDGIQNYVY